MALEDATNPMKGVSGPGSYAKRTDLEYKPDAYGEGVEYAANKAGAPLATAQKSPLLSEAPVVGAGGSAPAKAPGLYDPTNRPNEPITTGIDRGPGEGSSALGMNKMAVKTSDTLAKLLPFDTDGSITILYQQAVARGD